MIFHPTDGRKVCVGSGSPGMTGMLSFVNEAGVAMGVDTLRSAAVNISHIGINSILLMRHVADYANSTSDAINIIKQAQRGCSWLYPLCDSTGDCAIVEALATTNVSAEDYNPLRFIPSTHHGLLRALPNATFIRQHASNDIWINGGYARRANWSYPLDYLKFNPALFALDHYPYNASGFLPTGSIFANWTEETKAQVVLQDKYFPPPRPVDDIVVVSNFAMVPEARITMMNWNSDFLQALGGGDLQWRFDTLTSLVRQAHGKINLELAKYLILFLAPDRTPGFWNDYLYPNNTMSAQVEGSITVANLVTREIQIKSGYYTDNWIGVNLMQYV